MDPHKLEEDIRGFLAAAKCIGDIVFGLKTHRQEYIDSAIRALPYCVTHQEGM